MEILSYPVLKSCVVLMKFGSMFSPSKRQDVNLLQLIAWVKYMQLEVTVINLNRKKV